MLLYTLCVVVKIGVYDISISSKGKWIQDFHNAPKVTIAEALGSPHNRRLSVKGTDQRKFCFVHEVLYF